MTFKTSDGYTFYLLRDGSVADSKIRKDIDMSWPSLGAFLESLALSGVNAEIVMPTSQGSLHGLLEWHDPYQPKRPRWTAK
jgi:hypothetical protein